MGFDMGNLDIRFHIGVLGCLLIRITFCNSRCI